MVFYALTDARLADSWKFGEVVEFYPSREEAEAALRDVLADEPAWASELLIAEVGLGSVSAN